MSKAPNVSPGVAVLTTVVVIGGFCLYALFDPLSSRKASTEPPPPPEREFTPSELAWSGSQAVVEKQLKVPTSAKYGCDKQGYPPAVCVRELSGAQFLVSGWVDSQNALGTMMRSDFRVLWKREANGDWTLVSGPEIEQR
jgi:hypothetical protein